jgi:tartrate dehydratase beta subunit/fumarate hydratase class I family protein
VHYLGIFHDVVGYACAVQGAAVLAHDASSEHTNRRYADLVRVNKITELRIISWYLYVVAFTSKGFNERLVNKE